MLLNTSISRRGNGSEVATHVSLIANGCRSEHWASTHAHSEDLKNLTVQCNEGQWFGANSEDRLALLPFNETRYVERLEEQLSSCTEEGRHFFSSSSSRYSDWGAGKSVKKLDSSLKTQSVLVNFTV